MNRLHLQERALVEWVDKEDTTCSLGSCLLVARQAPDFTILTVADDTGRLSVGFSLVASIHAQGSKSKRKFFLAIPHDALYGEKAFSYKPLKASTVNRTSRLDISTLEESGISTSGRVIRVAFNLACRGTVMMPDFSSKHKTITPATLTSYDLLLGLESLSKATCFTVYVKHSDYAMQGLGALRRNLDSASSDPGTMSLGAIFDGRKAVPVDWHRVVYRKRRRESDEPPRYEQDVETQRSRAAHEELHARSPRQSTLEAVAAADLTEPKSQLKPTIAAGGLQEDRLRLPQTSLAPQQSHRQAHLPPSPSNEAHGNLPPPHAGRSSDVDADTVANPAQCDVRGEVDNEQGQRTSREASLELLLFDAERADLDAVAATEMHLHHQPSIDSDEEREAFANAVRAAPGPRLLCRFTAYVHAARAINPDMHVHTALEPRLGQMARLCVLEAEGRGQGDLENRFAKVRAWCSSLLFWDPLDNEDRSGAQPEQEQMQRRRRAHPRLNACQEGYQQRRLRLMSDMAALATWAGGLEVEDGPTREAFEALGLAARRAVALLDVEQAYEERKSKCIALVFVAREKGN